MYRNEQGYLDLIDEVLRFGDEFEDRTGTGTIAVDSRMMKFDLTDNKLPLFTTKKMFTKGIVEELLFFMQGKTNTKELEAKGVNIWKGNTSREFLNKRGLAHLDVGDMGAGYGFQWRHFGAEYVGHDEDYTNEGFDQLEDIVTQIKNNPDSRRILMSAWNPDALDDMALPPCHVLFQVHVNKKKGTLSSTLYQRSADLILGVGYNVASYSILTHILAHITGYKAKEFTWVGGNVHIYNNHIDAAKEQLLRKPMEPPTFEITCHPTISIDTIKSEHLIVKDYKSHPKLTSPTPMAV